MKRKLTALKRYEAEGYHFEYVGRRFPKYSDEYHVLIEEFTDEHRHVLLSIFAKHRREAIVDTVQMLGCQSIETGLTPDELLQHHWYSRWQGGLTRSERARLAAQKAWRTIRAKRRATDDEATDISGH